MGLVFLAAITELPGLVTPLAVVVSGNAALALTNMFGSTPSRRRPSRSRTRQPIDSPEAKEEAAASSASSLIPGRADRLLRVSLGVLRGALMAKHHFQSSRIAEPRLQHPGYGVL